MREFDRADEENSEQDLNALNLNLPNMHDERKNGESIESRLSKSERQSHAWLEYSPVCTKIVDLDFNLKYMSKAGIDGLGIDDIHEYYGKPYPFSFYPEEFKSTMRGNLERVKQSGEVVEQEAPVVDVQGNEMWFHSTLVPVFDDANQLEYIMVVSLETTERRRAEEQRVELERKMLHAQKLESLGVLSGGIAHDLNNILMGVLGNANLALDTLSPESAARSSIQAIESSARLAADLASQMLAYSGKGQFVLKSINLNDFVTEMTHLLEASISKKATLHFDFSENLPLISGDATQVRQIIMNLITNASEALEEADGVVTVSTGAIHCDRAYLEGANEVLRAGLEEPLEPGRYTYIEVSDSGCGMSEKTIAKIFDPFYTTKFTGRGLGLSAVVGILRGHKAGIEVYSEPGKGTTFKLLFPSLSKDTQLPSGNLNDTEVRTGLGTGTILLVDDDEMVCDVGRQMLTKLGFDVITALSGSEAIEIFSKSADSIQCVLLDMTMPHLDGEQTFEALQKIKQDAHVILCSGYHAIDLSERFAGKGLAGFIHKPYTLNQLREGLQEILT